MVIISNVVFFPIDNRQGYDPKVVKGFTVRFHCSRQSSYYYGFIKNSADYEYYYFSHPYLLKLFFPSIDVAEVKRIKISADKAFDICVGSKTIGEMKIVTLSDCFLCE